jgi:hypothetical protein
MVLRGCEALERALAVAAEGGLSGLEAWYSDVI